MPASNDPGRAIEFTRKGGIEELPVLKGFPDAKADGNFTKVFEMATITRTPTHQTDYSMQDHGGVLGYNPSTMDIYLAGRTMVKPDGIYGYPGSIRAIPTTDIAEYVITGEGQFRTVGVTTKN